MLQEQLANPAECWSLVVEALRNGDWTAAEIGADLGSLTARLHLAMATDADVPAFAPVAANELDIERWKSALTAGIDRVSNALGDRLEWLTASDRELAETYLTIAPNLRRRASGFESLLGLPLIRVHGDYHLGQVLRLEDGRMSIVDFEGEPQRPIHERRMKTSSLKDVTGMLRSFSYARGAAADGLDDSQIRLSQWEAQQRRSFLAEYERIIVTSDSRLIPSDPGDLEAALVAWEIDKALYEVMYELSSRPTWLWLPLSSLVRFG
jgi:trehalose synthase-fused probable maltokinase